MNRKGLELIRQRQTGNDEENLVNLLNNDLLPNLFKTYINHYQIGESWVSGGERILVNEKTGDEIWLNQISMFEPTQDNEYHACLDYIFSYEQLIIEIEKYHNEVENWNKLGFVQIGLMHWSDVLLLGVEDTNREEIWRYGTGDLKSTCSKLANNIFEFMTKLKESIDHECLKDYNIELEQIYKRLNESIWRVNRSDK